MPMNFQWDSTQRQLAILAVGVSAGMLVGTVAPGPGAAMSPATWPVLAAVLYATFLQVHIRSLPEAMRNRRFLVTAFVANFVIVPILVATAVLALPMDEAVGLGVLLVLLAPCTDWFVSFTHLGRGDTRLAVAMTPILLVAQFLLVPLYLWFLTDTDLAWQHAWPLVFAFLFVILIPLAAAGLTQRAWGEHGPPVRHAGRAVVPLLGLTLFLVAASEAPMVWEARGDIGLALGVFVVYVGVAPLLARLLTGLAQLSAAEGRTLAFNLGTRNSFVVLPIALSLPPEYALGAAVIAAQSVVELGGMLAYVRWVPARLFPGEP